MVMTMPLWKITSAVSSLSTVAGGSVGEIVVSGGVDGVRVSVGSTSLGVQATAITRNTLKQHARVMIPFFPISSSVHEFDDWNSCGRAMKTRTHVVDPAAIQ
jgi:hypothetical protein